jgi:hypothetical protein
LAEPAVVLVVAASVGVGASSAAGGSREGAGEELAGEELAGADAETAGRTSFTRGPAEAASLASTGEPAALPSRTPNPRKASTSSALTFGAGSLRAAAWGSAAPVGSCGGVGGAAGERSSRRSRSPASSGLRDPRRVPQSRQ